MKRPYANKVDTEELVRAFVGREALGTKAQGLFTLFLVGKLAVPEITELLDKTSGVKHIYFGANNNSFSGEDLLAWTSSIKYFLREGMWCTLDFRIAQSPLVQKTGLCRQARFIPVLRVTLPHAIIMGNNATLKLDDVYFAGSNPGIWSHGLNAASLHSTKALTPWSTFNQDEEIT